MFSVVMFCKLLKINFCGKIILNTFWIFNKSLWLALLYRANTSITRN